MNTIKKYVIWSVLLSALIGLSGCGNSSSDVGSDVNSDVDSGVYVIIPSDDAKASDFSMTLDVEESTVEGDWKTLSSASGDDPLSASVVAQGNYGNFVVEDDALRYLKTVDTNETDTGILEISNKGGTVQVTVSVHSLYWKKISEADGHTSAIKSDGTLWSWGVNNDGQLGNGTTDDSTTPVQEDTGSAEWVSTSSGGKHTAAVKSDGTIWSWGLNGYGQLGDGTTDSSSAPVQEETEATDWSSVRCGDGYSVAKKFNGEKWRWGRRNTRPVANDQSVITDENVAKAIKLTGSDADNDPLTYIVVSGPSNGTLTGSAPNLTYTPDTDYDGADSFTFKVNDGAKDSAPATVSITVNPVDDNTAPVANDQTVVTDENVAKAITLTGSDADGDPLTYTVVTDPSNGTLTGTVPNLTYTPNTDYSGPDSFTFTVNDGTVDSAPATVSITVNAGIIVNTPPVANDQAVVTDENVATAITLTGSDADSDPLTYAVVNGPSNGTLSGTAPNLTYTPNTDYDGPDSFTFTVNDGTVDSAPATVSITVNPVVVNTPPVANDQAVVTDENVAKAITLTGSDADSDPLTYAVETGPSNGTLSGTAPNLTYTPDTDYDGLDSFTFTVNDGTVDSAVATVSITVNSVYASDDALAQIGLEADDPDVVDSIITIAQLNVILPVLTDINAAYETAYQDYIDENPNMFSSPAERDEVQDMVDAVNAEQSAIAASDTVLAQIGLEADDPDTVNSVVTVAQLNLILPVLTDVNVTNETAYQDYIDENPDSFASPAAQEEVQAMVDAVNAAQGVNTVPTASDFNLTLDVNESTVIGDWPTLSSADDADGDPLTALVKTQGTYGTCTVTDDSLAYLKTIETNATDTCELEISDGTDAVQITVMINALYWKQISAGNDDHTVAIKSDGTLWGWGDNANGQLGDGTIEDRYVPTQESTEAADWSSVSGGYYHTVAVKTDGTLWSWGRNDGGQLGDGTTTNSLVPIQESTLATDWSSVSAGYSHTVALKDDDTLWSWGRNSTGQLGDGTIADRSVPTQESTAAEDWSSVSAGHNHTAALKDDGTLWAWGWNGYGQLGDGTTINRLVPTQESTLAEDWSSVSAGKSHTVAIKDDRMLWAWGYNSNGQLGNGTTTDSLVPIQESTLAADWSSVSAGGYHTAALKDDGTLWAWGHNGDGQLGDGTIADRSVPTQESTLAANWSSVSTGSLYTVALKSDGTFWAWGYNSNGQLGNGTDTNIYVPTLAQPRQPAASDAVFAQIGAEGDSGDTVNSVVTIAQLNAILPPLSGIVPANEAAYQDYIDANPDLFSEPATQVEVQAMIDEVNAEQSAITASDDILAQIGLEADNPDVVDSEVTVAQLGDILPALTDVDPAYETAYQDHIDANPDLFDSPATQTEVQDMVDTVNAEQEAIAVSDDILAQIGLEADNPDTVDSEVTVAELGDILPALTDVDVANETVYQDYIDENPDLFSEPATQLEVQAMIVAVNAAGYSPIGILDTTFGSKDTLDIRFGTDGIIDPATGQINDVVSDNAGNIYISGGEVAGAVISKYDSNGTLDTTFGTDGIAVYGNSTVIFGMTLDSSSNIYVTGVVSNGTEYDMIILKYTSAGVLDTTFGSSGAAIYDFGEFDTGNDLVIDSSGNIYVTGSRGDGSYNQDMVTWKYTSAGILDTTFGSDGIVTHNGTTAGGNSYDEGYGIILDESNNIYVTGMSQEDTTGDLNMLIWKYTNTGVLDSTFGSGGIATYNSTSYDYGWQIVRDGLGNLYVAGGIRDSTTNDDVAVWKYTSAGVLDTTFGLDGIAVYDNSGGYDQGTDIVMDRLGSIYVTGHISNGANNDMVTLKYTSNGVLDTTFASEGIIIYDSGLGDEGWANTLDSIGNLYVVGTAIWKYTGTGIIVHHNAAGGDSSDIGWGIATDTSGNVYVTGESRNSAGNEDMVIWKYDSSGNLDSTFGIGGIVVDDGAAGIANSLDSGSGIVLDSSGNIYVTGTSINNVSRGDMVIWKYDSSGNLDSTFGTGGIVVHDGAAGVTNSEEYMQGGIVLDSSGNVYVTGYSKNSAYNEDMVIWKYDSSGTLDNTFGTGGIVVYDGPVGIENSRDAGWGIVLDSSGNVYVSGIGKNSAGNQDMVIWKYDSSGTLDDTFGTGGIVFNDGASGGTGDYGEGLVLDGSGNIYVTGETTISGNYDMVIWKYNSSGNLDSTFGTGGVVVHEGAAGGTDDSDGGWRIVLDSSGNVYVTGGSINSAGNADMVIWKYDSSGNLDSTFGTGGIVVSDGAAGGTNGEDFGSGIVLDGSGNMYVSGYSDNSAGNLDMVIWKFK